MRQRFVQSFSTSGTEHEAIDAERLGKPYVAFIYDGQYIDWNTLSPTPPVPPEPVYSAMPLTLEIVQGGTITFRGYSSWLEKNVIECSRDNGETWTTLTPTAEGTTIRVSKGEKLILKGHNSSYARANAFCKFDESTAHFNVYGNIMSLIDYDNYMTLNSLTDSYVFTCMFRACKIHNVDIYLPATALTPGCYQGLFELNAETNYYQKVKITCLATDITAEDCTRDWLRGVLPATGTFVKHPNTTWTTGESGIPAGWTVEDANI